MKSKMTREEICKNIIPTILFGILGIIGVIIASFVVSTLNMTLHIALQSFSLLYILPMGGIFVGVLGSAMFFGGKFLLESPVRKKDIYFTALLGVFTFFSVYYIEYHNTYTVPEGFKVSYEKPVAHVSLRESMSFYQYLDLINTKGGNESINTDFILFLWYLIATMFGGTLLGMIIQKIPYCNSCKKYYKTKTYGPYEQEFYGEMQNIFSSEEGSIKEKLNSLPLWNRKNELFSDVRIPYCKECLT